MVNNINGIMPQISKLQHTGMQPPSSNGLEGQNIFKAAFTSKESNPLQVDPVSSVKFNGQSFLGTGALGEDALFTQNGGRAGAKLNLFA